MVRLNSITTKTGDAGRTRLGDGSQVSKTDQQIEVLGCLDELNSILGVCSAQGLEEPYFSWIRMIQNDLFDLGAELSIPKVSRKPGQLKITSASVKQLDDWLEELQKELPAIESFILPGGTLCTAMLHWARSVCRRAERETIRLFESLENHQTDSQAIIYLNRLSDLLFQIARITEDPENPAPLWKPGKNQ